METPPSGKLVVISGPSGAGKTTVVRGVLKCSPVPLALSVSATTREPRSGERDGVDYHFLTPEQFEAERQAGAFLECFEVYGRGHWYGTLRRDVTAHLERGTWVVLEIDVNGAMDVADQFPDAITIFLRPASMQELERRLRGRGTESEESIARRLEVARRELDFLPRYKFDVVNETVETSIQQICDILKRSE